MCKAMSFEIQNEPRAKLLTVVRAAAMAALLLPSCHREDPPSPPVSPPSVSVPVPVPVPDAGVGVDAGVRVGDTDAAPPEVDAGALPQTRDKPEPSSSAMDTRAKALVDAIVHDDPERGLAFFFPVAAYAQVKAVTNPESDWRRRLVANFTRDIHALKKELGEDAQFLRIEVPKGARWVEPGEEYNRLGYYRVYGAQIVCAGKNGRERPVRISSMISWRGEWYVVHLTGFK
jgi:hypothetical protein